METFFIITSIIFFILFLSACYKLANLAQKYERKIHRLKTLIESYKCLKSSECTITEEREKALRE